MPQRVCRAVWTARHTGPNIIRDRPGDINTDNERPRSINCSILNVGYMVFLLLHTNLQCWSHFSFTCLFCLWIRILSTTLTKIWHDADLCLTVLEYSSGGKRKSWERDKTDCIHHNHLNDNHNGHTQPFERNQPLSESPYPPESLLNGIVYRMDGCYNTTT